MTIGIVLGTGIPTLSTSAGPAGIVLGLIAGGLLVVTAAALVIGSAQRRRSARRRLTAVA